MITPNKFDMMMIADFVLLCYKWVNIGIIQKRHNFSSVMVNFKIPGKHIGLETIDNTLTSHVLL